MEAKPVPDKRRLPHWWYYLLFPALTVQGFFVRRVLGLIWGNIFVVYGLIPLLDQMIKQDWQNPTLEEIMKIEKQNRYRFCLYIVIFLEWLLFFVSVVKQTEVTVWTIAPMLFIRANMYASGFLVAHELFHKENHLDKFVGTVHMIKSCYMHFMVEHIYGHHKNVSTPLDPASAPKDMNVYEFIPHSVKGGYLSAYKINPRFVTLSTIASLMLILGIWKFVGIQAMLMHIVSVVGGVSYLEAINYVEHYGLRRKQLSNGSYEKVTIRHSWNSAHTISNFFFFKLQRHSDHH
jgi:alkane 1-monooxygenase